MHTFYAQKVCIPRKQRTSDNILGKLSFVVSL